MPFTLGARGFSCAVSGIGHVCIGDPRFAARAGVSAAEAKRSISVRCAREKTTGTQGKRPCERTDIFPASRNTWFIACPAPNVQRQ